MEASKKSKNDAIDIDKPPTPKKQSKIFLEYFARKTLIVIRTRNLIQKRNRQEVYLQLKLKSGNQPF